MSLRSLTKCFSIVVACWAISCNSDSTSPVPTAGSLQIISGDGQVGTVAAELPGRLAVRLIDINGKPIARREVRFVVAAGGGALAAASAITDDNGVAEDRWTLGKSTSGDQRVEASAAVDRSHATQIKATFGATARADVPDTVRVVSGNGQMAITNTQFADSLLAEIVDRFGNPAAGVVVTWSVSPTGGTLSRTTDTTSATGHTSVKFTAGSQSGDQTVVVAVVQLAAGFTVHVTPALNDLLGRHILDSLLGVHIPGSFDIGRERLMSVGSGDLEILPNGTGILTESYSILDPPSVSFQGGPAVAIYTAPVSLNGNLLRFGTDTGTVSPTEISLHGAYGYFQGGPHLYQRSVVATALPAAGPAAGLVLVSGNNQQGKIGSDLTQPVVVRATGATGQPVAGQVVRFQLRIGTDGLVNRASARADVTTDANGLAQAVWTLGSFPGSPGTPSQQLTAMIVSSTNGIPPSVVWFYATPVP